MPARRNEANGEWQQQMEVHIRLVCCLINDHQIIKAIKLMLRMQLPGPIMTITNRISHFAAIEANLGVLERPFKGFIQRKKLDQLEKGLRNLLCRQAEQVVETIKPQLISYTCTRATIMDQMGILKMAKRSIRAPCRSVIHPPWLTRYRTQLGWKTRFARDCSLRWANSLVTIRRRFKLSET